ncbi:MAG TPA: hypothetical protein VGP47_01170 [Parachlamydiaceae bacterium]|nr:hypothetical protein [Parachlamydiaceae bacterium]
MSFKTGSGTEGEGVNWSLPNPLKDISNSSNSSHPAKSAENKNVIQELASKISEPASIDARKKTTSLDNRVSKEKNITSSRLKKASDIFKISRILTKISRTNPLAPLGGGNANDVYITDFKNLDKTNLEEIYKKPVPAKDKKEAIKPNPKDPVKMGIEDFEKLAKHEKPISKTAEAIKANTKNLDIVFKPGLPAAVRANICFGLTQMFDQFENVIAPTKKGQASVVSKIDYNVEREIVYNPASDSTYLINKKYMQHQVVVKVTDEEDGEITGRVGNKEVTLIPVEGHPGFFQIVGLPKDTAKEIDIDYSDSEDGGEADVANEDDSFMNDIYVMHVSPSRIDQWANPDVEWKLVTIKNEVYLVPIDTIVEISTNEAGGWFNGDNDSMDFDSSISDDLESSISDDFESEITSNGLNELEGVLNNGSNESGESESGESIDSNAIISSKDIASTDDVEIIPSKVEPQAKSIANIDGTKYEIIIENDHFKLLPANTKIKSKPSSLKDLESKYVLVLMNEKQVLVPKLACVHYNEGSDSIHYEGKDYDVAEQDETSFNLSPAYDANTDFDEKAFVKVDKERFLGDHIIHQKNQVNYVTRNNMDYTILDKDNGLEVVGENVSGMVQLKVDNIFQKPVGEKKALDLLKPSESRDKFYSRIDMPSYIEAFLAVILLRPQDGKVIDLAESNILFQALPNKEGMTDPLDPTCKLRPVIIDLDETMPAANDYTQDPEFVEQGEKTNKNIHAVRNGLMGFPQAEELLVGKEKQLGVECLKSIIDKKSEVKNFLFGFLTQKEQKRIKSHGSVENKENFHSVDIKKLMVEKQPGEFGEDNINAYTAVVDKLEEFIKQNENNDWSLAQLFFFVFPEYADQWKMLGNMEPIKKAMHIGADDPTRVKY